MTRDRRPAGGGERDGATDQAPWPGKRTSTARRRFDRDDVLFWPGKRTRTSARRRPPDDPLAVLGELAGEPSEAPAPADRTSSDG